MLMLWSHYNYLIFSEQFELLKLMLTLWIIKHYNEIQLIVRLLVVSCTQLPFLQINL